MQANTLSATGLRDLLAAHITRAGDVNGLAVQAGCRPEHIEKVRAGWHAPCAALLRFMGLRAVACYAPARAAPQPGTAESLAADYAEIDQARAGALAADRRVRKSIASAEGVLARQRDAAL